MQRAAPTARPHLAFSATDKKNTPAEIYAGPARAAMTAGRGHGNLVAMRHIVTENRPMKHAALTAALVLAAATAASAQSNNLYTRGSVQYDYLSSNGSDVSFAYADLAIGFGFGGGSSLPMGFELGVLGIASDSGGPFDNRAALFPTFWVDTSVGRFSVGAPRSAVGSAIQIPRFGGSRYLSLIFGEAIGVTDFVQVYGEAHSYGARFDGFIGGFDAGLSVHQFTGTASDATSVTGYFGRDYGALDFTVGFEAINTGSTDLRNYLAQVGYDAGQFGGHLTLVDANLSSDLLVLVDAFYKPLDWLTLNAGYGTAGSSDDFYSVNAEVSFLKNGYAGVGYLDGFGGGGNGVTSAYVGWKLNY
jgi:hypothetical protein